jgi:hypothetical protein
VGGYLYINADAKLDAPALTSVGGYLYIEADAKLDAPALYPKGFNKFRVIDGLANVILSSKTKDGVEILLCREAKVKDQKLIGNKLYVARQNGQTAHGKTIKAALEDLAFKVGSRDIEQYRNMTSETRKSVQQWVYVYRTITGACELGVQQFLEKKGNLKRSYTLAQILEETIGAYGHEQFRKVVNP